MTQRLVDGIDVGLGGCGLHECFLRLAGVDVPEISKGNWCRKEQSLQQGVFPFVTRLWRSSTICVDLENEGRSATTVTANSTRKVRQRLEK